MSNNILAVNKNRAPEPRDELIARVTASCLETIPRYSCDTNQFPNIKACVLSDCNDEIELANIVLEKSCAYRSLKELEPQQTAIIINHVFPTRLIPFAGQSTNPDSHLLSIYNSSGPDAGIYVIHDYPFMLLIRSLNKSCDKRYKTEVLAALRDIAPIAEKCSDRDLIAVNNGIFNYATQQLLSFSPDFVFTSKSRVNYVANAPKPILTHPDDNTPWDTEAWMFDLTDNSELTELLWQILGAVIRPTVRWNKVAFFYSEVGNNGKGTLAALARNLCGQGTHTSIAISDFAGDFVLEPLLQTSAIIVDENEVGCFLDKAANFKASITGDVLQINRKFKTPIPFEFSGFQIQCLNGFPKTKDKSASFLRRLLFVPFPKSFTGREKPHIKQDFLRCPAVLEYILWRVLSGMPQYYSLSEPAACQQLLADFNGNNNPVLRFWSEFATQFVWDLLPFPFLYELFKSWFRTTNPSGSIPSNQSFNKDVLQIVKGSTEWYCDDPDKQIRSAGRMVKPELLIAEYNLIQWYSPNYRGGGTSPYHYCKPALKTNYRGIQRYTNTQTASVQAPVVGNVTPLQVGTAPVVPMPSVTYHNDGN